MDKINLSELKKSAEAGRALSASYVCVIINPGKNYASGYRSQEVDEIVSALSRRRFIDGANSFTSSEFWNELKDGGCRAGTGYVMQPVGAGAKYGSMRYKARKTTACNGGCAASADCSPYYGEGHFECKCQTLHNGDRRGHVGFGRKHKKT
jgi:hypothetical protein